MKPAINRAAPAAVYPAVAGDTLHPRMPHQPPRLTLVSPPAVGGTVRLSAAGDQLRGTA